MRAELDGATVDQSEAEDQQNESDELMSRLVTLDTDIEQQRKDGQRQAGGPDQEIGLRARHDPCRKQCEGQRCTGHADGNEQRVLIEKHDVHAVNGEARDTPTSLAPDYRWA